jgi:hypothetical protein
MTTVTTPTCKHLKFLFSIVGEIALLRTEFRHPCYAPEGFCSVRGREEGPDEAADSFPWTAAVKVLAVCVLKYAAWGRRGRAGPCPTLEGWSRSPAATLNFALSKKPRWLCGMFGRNDKGSAYLPDIVKRKNPDLKRKGEPVVLWLDHQTLAPEDVEIVIVDRRGEDAREKELGTLLSWAPERISVERSIVDPEEMTSLAEAIEASYKPQSGRPHTILTLKIPGPIEDWNKIQEKFLQLRHSWPITTRRDGNEARSASAGSRGSGATGAAGGHRALDGPRCHLGCLRGQGSLGGAGPLMGIVASLRALSARHAMQALPCNAGGAGWVQPCNEATTRTSSPLRHFLLALSAHCTGQR